MAIILSCLMAKVLRLLMEVNNIMVQLSSFPAPPTLESTQPFSNPSPNLKNANLRFCFYLCENFAQNFNMIRLFMCLYL